MPNINAVVNEQIRRLARREIKSNTKSVKKATAHYRRDIAALKRQVSALTRTVSELQKQEEKRGDQLPVPESVEGLRFRAMGVKAHRAKLGLSADLYGKLVGVSGLTIYKWEAGKNKPRQAQKAKWLAVRGLGKREAMQRLGLAGPATPPIGGTAKSPVAGKRQKRGQFRQTAEEMILSLLKGRKALTTSQINASWKKAGRGGVAADTVSKMVKARKLKRKPLGGKKGSEYSVR